MIITQRLLLSEGYRPGAESAHLRTKTYLSKYIRINCPFHWVLDNDGCKLRLNVNGAGKEQKDSMMKARVRRGECMA